MPNGNESIKLENFRNYETLELTLDPGTNIFYGENAQGKTNILESVYLCGTTKSHKGSKDREMIRFDQEEAHIRMKLDRDGSSYSIDAFIRKTGPRELPSMACPYGRRENFWVWETLYFFLRKI